MKRKKVFFAILLILLVLVPIINVNAYETVACGNITEIPRKIPELTAMMIRIIQVAVPLILVISGSITMIKSLTSKKEDEFKAARVLLTKKLIIAGIIFLSIAIVKLFVSIVANATDDANISHCIECFTTGRVVRANNGRYCRLEKKD